MSEKKMIDCSFDRACDVNFILRYRTIALIVLLVLTGFFCFQLKGIKMAADPMESMYLAGHKFLPALHAINKMAPAPRMLICILDVKSGDIYNYETIRKIDSITRGLMGIEGILPTGITSLTMGIDHYNNTAQGLSIESILGKKVPETKEDFEVLKRKVAVNPMGPGKYVSYDGTAVMITAPLLDIEQKAQNSYDRLTEKEKAGLAFEKYKDQEKAAFNANLVKSIYELKSKEDDTNHTLYFMGEEVITAQMTSMGKLHIPIAACVMMVFILIFLAGYFRTFQGVFIPVFSMIVPLLWGMGLLSLRGIELNPMAILFPLILGILSLAYSILTMKQYYLLYDKVKDKKEAIATAYRNVPVSVSILTAGLVTMGLCVSDVPMIKTLGYLGLFWSIGAFAVVVLINPILMSFFPPPNQAKKFHKVGICQSMADVLVRPSLGGTRFVMLIILALILAIGGFSARRLAIGDNIPGVSYIRPNHPWNQCFNLFSKKFMGPYQLLVYVKARDKGGLLDPEALGAMGDFSNYLKHECGARDSIAFDYMVRMARVMLMDGNPKWQTIPVSEEKIEGLAGMVMEEGGVESFMDKTFTQATISPFFPESDAKNIDKYVSKMQAYIDSHPFDKVEFSLGGGLLGMTKVLNDGIRDTYPKILTAAFIGMFILGILASKSLLLSLIMGLPIVAVQVVLWLIMTSLGMPVSLPVVPVTAVSIGFGFMFGYYLLRQIAFAYQESADHDTAIRDGLGNIGGVVIFMSILIFTTCLPWFFIGLKFQSNMVLIFGITLILESITALIFVPALISWVKPDFNLNI
ncbi:MAG: MMPL family transporter [Thermodesulfobacteriota bacterium]|nr:MMPL family transporter [Thermodesulfobacteriota bacterium]